MNLNPSNVEASSYRTNEVIANIKVLNTYNDPELCKTDEKKIGSILGKNLAGHLLSAEVL